MRRANQRADSDVQSVENLLDPQALTIGFARRFSTYKRADLVIHDCQRALEIFSNSEQPVQLIFAGKSHPADDQSKQIIQNLIEWSRQPDLRQRVAFIENYNLQTAQRLVQGVDVWLNTPQRPQEASGTSGQKASFNGGINFSILDGWWPEVYQAGPDGSLNGWAIGASGADDQDQQDAESLYRRLEEEIIPLYYDRDAEGLPRGWIQLMKASIRTIAPYFNTDRMVIEYVTQIYLPESK